jgi:putative PEP-CTERM system TPR-repeat lipoprotein
MKKRGGRISRRVDKPSARGFKVFGMGGWAPLADLNRSPMKSIKPKDRCVCALVVTAAVLCFGGCDFRGDSEQAHLQRAKDFKTEGKLQSSAIELQNALQKNPDSAEARWLLGEVYLDLGQAPEAEQELVKAKELGFGEEAVQVPLGRALLAGRLFQRVISEIEVNPGFSPASQSKIIALRGEALFGLYRLDQACALFAQSIDVDSSYVPAYWGLAKCAGAKGDLPEARAQLEKALKLEEKNGGTWRLLGDIERYTNHHPEAEAAYANALKYKPDDLDAMLGRASARIIANKPEEAAKDIDAVLTVAKANPVANYLRGVIQYGKGNYPDAKTAFEQALAVNPGYFPAVLWLGYTNYAQKNYAQAESQFAQYVTEYPGAVQVQAQRALSQAMMGGSKAARQTLGLLRNVKIEDPQSLSVLGQTHMLLGEKDLAAQYFREVVAKMPQRAEARVELANALLQKGDRNQALEQLQKAIALSPGDTQADEQLIQILIQSKQLDKALAAISALQAKQPKSPIPHLYAGVIAIEKNNPELAEAEFLKAWELAPDDPRAGNHLAVLAVRKGRIEEARTYYQKVLERNKDDLATSMGLYNLELVAKRPDEARKLLEHAISRYPTAAQPAALLAENYLAVGQPVKALDATQAAAQANPDDPHILEMRGVAYLANGDLAKAVEIYQRLIKLLPDSADASFKLGTALAALKNPTARASFVRALKLAPTHAGAKIALIQLDLQEGKNDEALRLSRELRKEHAELAEGVLAESLALANQKKIPQALQVLEDTRKTYAGSEPFAFALANLRWATGDKEGSLRVISEWQNQHPDDLSAAVNAAQTYLSFGREKQAAEAYEKALTLAPMDARIMNNIAWLSRKTDPKRALELAEKANSLMPDDAAIADTLGWMLLEGGTTGRGLELLQKAFQLSPDASQIHFHYAAALAKSGQKEKARRELERLLESGRHFPQEAEARSLLGEL